MGVQILLEELVKVAVLGAGAFGQVTLVKRNSKYFALKVLSKAHIVHNGLQACPIPSMRAKSSMYPAPMGMSDCVEFASCSKFTMPRPIGFKVTDSGWSRNPINYSSDQSFMLDCHCKVATDHRQSTERWVLPILCPFTVRGLLE